LLFYRPEESSSSKTTTCLHGCKAATVASHFLGDFSIPKLSLVTKVSFVYMHVAIASLLACSTKAAITKFTLLSYLRTLASGLMFFCLFSYFGFVVLEYIFLFRSHSFKISNIVIKFTGQLSGTCSEVHSTTKSHMTASAVEKNNSSNNIDLYTFTLTWRHCP